MTDRPASVTEREYRQTLQRHNEAMKALRAELREATGRHDELLANAARVALELVDSRDEVSRLRAAGEAAERRIAELVGDLDLVASEVDRMQGTIDSYRAELERVRAAATALIEKREEASSGCWYVNGDGGLALLEVLGIPYVPSR